MAVTKASKVIRFTADNDQYDSGGQKLKIKGIRLVAGAAADATASIREDDENGGIVMSLAAAQKTADESQLCLNIDTGKIHVDLSGAGAEVYVYVE